MVDLPTLVRHPQYPAFKEAYETQTKKCPAIELSDSIRSDMQARVGTAAACRRAGSAALPSGTGGRGLSSAIPCHRHIACSRGG